MTDSPIPNVGTVIDGRFELLSLLGEGGFGVVYKARQQSTGQLVAVKILLPSRMLSPARRDTELVRFRREMQLIGKLRHAHIVRLIDFGELAGGDMHYMVLEFIDGQPLSSWLEERGALSPRLAAHLMHQVADALHYAHDHGVVHRDLKPHNIMVTEGGYRPSVTVLDFGIAGLLDDARDADYQGVTGTRDMLGTPSYMSPEQINRRADAPIGPETDLFAWGLIFAECLTGQTVTNGETLMQVLFVQTQREHVALPGELGELALAPIVARATAREVAGRYHSAAEVIAELEAIAPEHLPDEPIVIDELTAALTSGAMLETVAGEHDPAATGAGPVRIGARQAAADMATMGAPASSRRDEDDRAASGPVLGSPADPSLAGDPPAPGTLATPDAAASKVPWLVGGLLVVALVVGAVVWAGSGGEATDDASATDTPATEGTPASVTPEPAPETAARPAERVEPAAPDPLAELLATVPAAEVALGLTPAQRTELIAAHGDLHEIDLEPRVAALEATTWSRPALEVMRQEVTWGLWREHATGALGELPACDGEPTADVGQPADAPVTGVTPLEAEAFCQALGMRLPTSREWEAVARSDGELWATDGPLDEARLAELAGQTRAGAVAWNHTPEQVYDLAGGVSEWVTCGGEGLAYCLDGYGVRGGAAGDAPIWFVPALMQPPQQGRSARCHRGEAVGFRCLRDAQVEGP